MYLHKIVCQNFGPLVMYISKCRQGFTTEMNGVTFFSLWLRSCFTL